MKKLFYVGIILVFLLFPCFSQNSFFDNYVYQSWNSFGGLSGTTANDIYQTKDGYINIGTYEGIVRFDGVKFTAFNRALDSDFSIVSARTILQDSRGDIWIGSNDEGLQKISDSGNMLYTLDEGLPNNSIRALCEDKDGNIWIGTAGGVVYLTPEGRLISPQFAPGTTANGVIASSIFCDDIGRIWLIISNDNGFFLYTNGVFRPLLEFEKFGHYFASAVYQDSTGGFWIGLGDKGLCRMINGVADRIVTNTVLDSVSTCAILEDKNGDIWFGSEKGLVVYTDGKFIEYKGAPELSGSNINKIIQDRENNIWFATDRNGIGKMTLGKFKLSRLGVTVNCLAETPDGRIWAGTDSGVVCYKDDELEENELTKATKGLRVRHVESVSGGKILVSCYTQPAQILYDGHSIKSWSMDEGLAGNKVRVAVETAPGEYYIGTTTGLSILHADGTVKTIKQADGLDTEYVMTIYKDTHGIVWVGTDGGGIFLLKNEEIFWHITSSNGIAGNVIFKISQDKNKDFWICTGSGLTRIKDFDATNEPYFNSITLNSENGLGTNSVFQILFDMNDNAWITNNHGIASISGEELKNFIERNVKTVNAKYYSKNDGLDSDGPTSTARSIVDRQGRLWFTMVDGIAIYDPQKVKEADVTPMIHIESILVDNVEHKVKDELFVLRPGTKRIDIKFTGLSFDAPERLMFSHMLTNFDENYSMPDMNRIVSYTNITPGRHSFVVYAINGNGIKSNNEEVMFLWQKPYIYQRVEFWAILAVLFMSSIFIFFRSREIRMKRENARLEELVKVRTADLEQEKIKSDNLLRSILPDKIADKLKNTTSYNKSFGENFENVTLLFSDIVGFTKVSSGHTAKEIVAALNQLFTLFDERAKRMGVEKIKTIGDAYMAACGIPEANENHARIMIDFARGMYQDLAKYNETADIKFQIRIGLNCGPVTAGVIGTTKFIYDVWGDTVNVASRMESAANPGAIRISEGLKNHLEGSDIQFSEPYECNIKGKGMMKTFEVIN
ncbi:MAG: hypothetical protein IKZ86_05460 [Spirochaetaceae bacterium]|nr:hypothetical protein [Spirochaetaceae bacterium]